MQDCRPDIPTAPKVIHDPIWGTHTFLPHEIAVMDCPLVQRLRRIYQTGFAFLTFPGTTHTRFDHSLGAAIAATKMLGAVARRHGTRVNLDPLRGDLADVRVAALLHDCGHGFSSHVSEALYRWHPAVLAARRSSEELADVKASELLSYVIITSEAFKTYLAEVNERCGTTLDAARIANLILGISHDNRSFIAECINGPFDSDRVDYILRDAYCSGLKTGIDLERLFHDVEVAALQDKRLHLVLRSTHAIEQLLWTKVHFFVRVYRHQKVLAADGILQALVHTVREANRSFLGVDFSAVSDFLRVTDVDILGANPDGLAPEVRDVLAKLKYRRLPHRCLAITPYCIKAIESARFQELHKLQRLNEIHDGLTSLKAEIWESIAQPKRLTLHSLVVALPSAPPLREASQVYVLLRGSSEPVTLNSLFRIDEWLTTYSESHWAGYVFADRKDLDEVTAAALSVLRNRAIPIDERIATAVHKPMLPAAAPALVAPSPTTQPAYASPRLPVLETFVQKLLSSGAAKPLENLTVILVLHFLTDLPPLLARLELLGLAPEKTWLVRKPYQYIHAATIRDQLRNKGYRIEECTAAEGPEEPARRVLRELQRSLKEKDRLLVIEDGGYLTPLLHAPDFADLLNKCVGAVEQTTKGLRAIQKVEQSSGLKIPVISVASSELKLRLEAAEVGDALAFTLENYYRTFIGKPLGFPILVLGYGAVGRNLASALASRGARVSVYDSDIKQRIDASVSKSHLEVLESLVDLGPFRLVVGTTGTTSLDARLLLQAPDGLLLASGSSDRLEFDVEGLREHVKAPVDENIVFDELVTWYRLDNGRSVGLLCDGYPINFIIGDGIAKSVIDPILAELVAGAWLLASGKTNTAGVHSLPTETESSLWALYRQFKH